MFLDRPEYVSQSLILRELQVLTASYSKQFSLSLDLFSGCLLLLFTLVMHSALFLLFADHIGFR